MFRKMIYLVSFTSVVGLVLTFTANAELIQHLDSSVEESVLVAADGVVGRWNDLSGNGNDAIPGIGTVTYPSSISFPGGSAGLDFGLQRNTMEIFTPERSTQWLDQSDGIGGFAVIIVTYTTAMPDSWCDMIGDHSAYAQGFGIRYNQDGNAQAYVKYVIGRGGAPVEVGDTIVWIFNYDASTGACYLWDSKNGYAATATRTPEDFGSGNAVTLGSTSSAGRFYRGLIGEVMVFDAPLSEDELALYQAELVYKWITSLAEKAYASLPTPGDGLTEVPRDGVTLSWKPGISAERHDVYFGASFDAVSNAIPEADPDGVYMGRQDSASLTLARLERGQTYYWRVDEVAGPTVYTGDVWSFTIELVAYPLAGEHITVIASSSSKDAPAENTINGSGLDANDLHSAQLTDSWLTDPNDPNPAWIQYDFDRAYKLHEMLVWNHNTPVEKFIGWGIREAATEYSTDGSEWIVLDEAVTFNQAPGTDGYPHNTTIDFAGATAKHVRINAISNWPGLVPINMFGLSEVRFLYVPVRATEPNPASGATDVDLDVILSWKAGREAAQHDVYLSTDEQAVIDGNAPVNTVTETSYDPLTIDLGTTYYWRVDEVNDAEIPPTWQGDVWNFNTQEYLVVEDFESYNDIPAGQEGSKLVYGTWADGFENPANGSTMGYNVPFQPTMETSIFHDGKQSAPLFYDNTVATYSEATANVADLAIGQDWTKHGIKTLSLWFSGDPNNAAEQMYTKVNGVKVVYDGDVADIQSASWNEWNIELASFGVNRSNVTELSIGFERIGAVGGKGMVLLDGIRLYSLRELEGDLTGN